MRAIPPSRRDMLVKWGTLVSDVHYVEPPNDRVVTDLTGSGANESSPESEHGYAKERVQCDYEDVVVEEIVRYLDPVSMFSDVELVSIKADIKSAFMRIPNVKRYAHTAGPFIFCRGQHRCGVAHNPPHTARAVLRAARANFHYRLEYMRRLGSCRTSVNVQSEPWLAAAAADVQDRR